MAMLPEEGCIYLPASLEIADAPEALLRSGRCQPLSREGVSLLDDCNICLCGLKESSEGSGALVRFTACAHAYHERCLLLWFEQRATCPTCGARAGKVFGSQPAVGTMRWWVEATALPGEAAGSRTIIAHWDFPAGHDPQGRRFAARQETGYLPDTEQGRLLLRLFVVAFRRRLMFDLGTSASRGRYWPRIAIHIKTNRGGGAQRHGYPDSGYVARALVELAERGVEAEEQAMPATPAVASSSGAPGGGGGRWRGARRGCAGEASLHAATGPTPSPPDLGGCTAAAAGESASAVLPAMGAGMGRRWARSAAATSAAPL